MRLLSRRIYRAFPELDPFSDEQCLRFVHAARKSTTHHFAIGISPLIAGTPVMIAGMLGSALLYNWLAAEHRSLLDAGRILLLLWILATLPLLGIGPAVGLWTRDILLRRRLRHVLRKSGQCPGCVYTLIGLAVSPESTVRCPECGLEVEVDPSLAELADIGATREATFGATGRFRREPSAAFEENRWWTARKKKWIRRGAVLVGVLVLSATATWGGYEFWLHAQAAAARADRITLAASLRALLPGLPPHTKSSSNGCQIIQEAAGLLDAANSSLRRESQDDPDHRAYPEATLSRLDPDNAPAPTDVEALKDVEYAKKVADFYAASGLGWHMDRIIATTYSSLAVPDGANVEEITTELQKLGAALRQVDEAIWAVGLRAQSKGEPELLLKSIEARLKLSRIGFAQPGGYPFHSALNARSGALHSMRELLLASPTKAQLDHLFSLLDRYPIDVALVPLVEASRLSMLDTAAVEFANPQWVRMGSTKHWDQMFGTWGAIPGRLGTYRENQQAINQLFDASRTQLSGTGQLDPDAAWSANTTDLIIPANLYRTSFTQSATLDSVRTHEAATLTMIALERYRIENGAYPKDLSLLIPKFLPRFPVDAWMRRPLGYHLIQSPDGTGPPTYLLFSILPNVPGHGGNPYMPNRGWAGWFGADGPVFAEDSQEK